MLNEREYLLVPPLRFFPARELEQPIYTRQCEIGKDIYGKKRRVDAILYHPRLYPECLVIQCKWQASGGSEPTMRRANASITKATYPKPRQVAT